jgi:1,4-dihydroxy-2-naphthoyl-CoA synthase
LDKPIVVAVHGAAIGGGTTMLTHCDFIYAGESTKFQMPFINLAVVPEFGSSCSVPARIGHLRAAELILLGGPYDARRAAELGLEMCRPAAYGAKRSFADIPSALVDVAWCARIEPSSAAVWEIGLPMRF